MIVLARVFGVLLFVLALVCGGCSIAFAPLVLTDLSGGGGAVPIWATGLLVAAGSIWGGIALWRWQGPTGQTSGDRSGGPGNGSGPGSQGGTP